MYSGRMSIITTVQRPDAPAIKSARGELSHTAASALVWSGLRAWQHWETDPANVTYRSIPLATWELFLLKTNQHPTHLMVPRF